MSVLLAVVLAIIWICVAFWPARVAGRKGHSFLGYFLVSLFFWPITLIVAYASENRTVAVGGPAPRAT